MVWLWSGGALHLFLYTFVINIAAAPVNFLVSLLFPVKCSYLNPESLPLISLSGVGGTLGWGVPFRNHSNVISEIVTSHSNITKQK